MQRCMFWRVEEEEIFAWDDSFYIEDREARNGGNITVEELTGELRTPSSGSWESMFGILLCQRGLLSLRNLIEKEIPACSTK